MANLLLYKNYYSKPNIEMRENLVTKDFYVDNNHILNSDIKLDNYYSNDFTKLNTLNFLSINNALKIGSSPTYLSKIDFCQNNLNNDSLSVGNTYIGGGLTELPTVGVFDKYSIKNIYSDGNPFGYLSDFSFGQSVIKASLHYNEKYLPSLVGALKVGNTNMRVGLTELPTVGVFDKYSIKNIYSDGNSSGYLSDFNSGQSVVKASLHSDRKYLPSLVGALAVGNTNMRVGLTELPTVGVFDKYSIKNIYSDGNPSGYLSDFTSGQVNFRTSLLSDENHWSNLDGSLAVANSYLRVDSPHLATFGISDKYINKNVYTLVNSLASSTDFILRQSNTSLLSDDNHWSNLDGSLTFANNYLGINSPNLSTLGISDRFINKNVYTELNSLASSTDFILGQNKFSTSLLSDKKGWSSLVGSKSLGSDLKFVENSNIGHLDWHLGINNISINSNSAIKEYDVINIGTDFFKRENNDLERYIKKECQKVAEIVKIDPNHIGFEISGKSQNPNINIYFVFTGSVTSNNLQIGDKNITIVNYGK